MHILEHVIWDLACFWQGGGGLFGLKERGFALGVSRRVVNLGEGYEKVIHLVGDIGSEARGAGNEARGMMDERGMATEGVDR